MPVRKMACGNWRENKSKALDRNSKTKRGHLNTKKEVLTCERRKVSTVQVI